MTALSVRGLTVLRAGRIVLQDASFGAQPGSITCVLGQAGAGKTSLLAAIAGLLPIRQGSVLVGGQDVTRLGPKRRGVGLLPPGSALADGRTVRAALLRLAGAGGAAWAGQVLDALGLTDVAGQDAGSLSHGQAALALAAARLLPACSVLLIDEAGAALDEPSRTAFTATMRDVAMAGRTVLIATRCPRMAQIADHLVLLSCGQVLQAGPPAQLYAEPRCAAAARLIGPANILAGVVREKRSGGFVWAASSRYVQAAGPEAPPPKLGSAVSLCLRPEHLVVLQAGEVADNIVEGQVATIEPALGMFVLGVRTVLGLLHAAVPAWGGQPASPGTVLRLGWAAHAACVVESGQT